MQKELVGSLDLTVLQGSNVKRFAIAVLKRLLVSIAILFFLIGSGYAYTFLVGPSDLAAARVMLLVAWPWALPQIFVVVALVWFIRGRAKRWRIA